MHDPAREILRVTAGITALWFARLGGDWMFAPATRASPALLRTLDACRYRGAR